ncbi:pilus assembly protein [Neisseria leonii]|uniref:Pilus assembly protein n=1 Tax=Neisseria leonii TaxID=2995413 RepID=A0A9X4IEQ0_9NEIS|nr:pilus assembly protein [Neisseria sp. 51.81]MDD9328437.1 pilus assembly protein [Neisseria sp. 51.81]
MRGVNEKGWVLLFTLAVLLGVSLLVWAAVQFYFGAQQRYRLDADRQWALQAAETALAAAEARIVREKLADEAALARFGENCPNGLCLPGRTAVWLRECGRRPCLETWGVKVAVRGKTAKPPRYLIEYLGTQDEAEIFRITVRAWGAHPNTAVTLQSHAAWE